ncbi:hypothetical protein [Salibacterium aidingense]|uniref:hypothetical protein n=1 Tax=Salibacterium aidingense TaxID=384933 RepID=UPI00047C510B|nr:hypothetical protein [Salibacterium aidingense]
MEKLTTILANIEGFYEKIEHIIYENSYDQNTITSDCVNEAINELVDLYSSNAINDYIITKTIDIVQCEEIQSLATFKEIELEEIESEYIIAPEFDVGSLIVDRTQEEYSQLLLAGRPHLLELKNRLQQILFL